MSLDTPASFIGTLGNGSPQSNLREAYRNRATNHSFFSFMLVDFDEHISVMLKCGSLPMCSTDGGWLISGTLSDYVPIVVCLMRKDSTDKQRAIGNEFLTVFKRAGFADVFADYESIAIDKTFYLKRR